MGGGGVEGVGVEVDDPSMDGTGRHDFSADSFIPSPPYGSALCLFVL